MRILDIDPEMHVAAIDLMVVITNSSNTVSALDKKQLESVFVGTTSDWTRLGGSRVPVKVFTPTHDAETYALFQQMALNRKSYASGSKALRDNDEIVRNVRLQPGGIGFVGLAAARSRRIRRLTIDGVEPVAENASSYRLSRRLYYYTIEQRAKPETLAFIRWATTDPEAIKIITAAGYAPPPNDR